jgi:predicted enzyme related to lactoylglutathione lyase
MGRIDAASAKEQQMTSAMKTVIYPVADLDTAKEIFTRLFGVEPYVDQPYYVGFRVDGQETGLDPNGRDKGMTGPVGYWHVDDIERIQEQLVGAGAGVQSPITDVGGGRLIATLTDPDGNPIGLLQDTEGA